MSESNNNQIISRIEAGSNLYWVSIGKSVPENYNIGIKNGLWAVKDEHANRIKDVKKGDYVLFYGKNSGFAICEILEGYFIDTTPVWSDDIYPNRVRISKPLLTAKDKPKDFHLCFKDLKGKSYISPNALSMATRGAGGIFRQLKTDEVHCIFRKLSWNVNKEEDLRQVIQDVLDGYLKAKSEIFNSTHPMYKLLKEQFPSLLEKITINSNLYKYDGSGQGNWAKIPWVAVLNKKITETVQSGYYPVYLFKEDMSGVYLSLNQGVTKRKNEHGTKKALEDLKSNSLNFREKINKYIENPEEYEENINLNHPLYEAGNIYAKYYPADNLPTEKELESDYEEILELYSHINETSYKLVESLEIIFNKLPLAKKRNEKVKGHEIGKPFSYISKAILDIANSIHPEKNYHSVAYYQANGNWYPKPYIYIEDLANKDKYSHWDQHFVGFWFPEDFDGVLFSLEQSYSYAKNLLKDRLGRKCTEEELQNYIVNHTAHTKKELKDSIVISNNLLEETSKLTNKNTIYGKYYEKNNLPSNKQIISDFKELLNLYSQLKPDELSDDKTKILQIIENSDEIKEAQNKFLDIIYQKADEIISTEKLGLPGDKMSFDAHWSNDLGIWVVNREFKDPHTSYLNAFGINKPDPNINLSVICEINISKDGQNKNVASAFAKDLEGNVYLIHSGSFAGIAKTDFLDNYTGELAQIQYGDLERQAVLVGSLNDPHFPDHVRDFIFEVAKFKGLISGSLNDPDDAEGLGFYNLDAGRAHIVRDICYLISRNDNLSENQLFNLLRENIIDDNYWIAYYQRSKSNTSPKYNLNSARTLDLVHKDELKLTKLGEDLVNNITQEEIFTHQYGLGIKKFFYKLAKSYDNIKIAMEILKEKKRLKFYNPTCKLTNRIMENFNDDIGGYYCKENFDENCEKCDRDFEAHINESSLPFEVHKKTGKFRGNVFWMTSRVTPMHLTGTDPVYSGNYIEWDFEAEKELELIPEFKTFTEFLIAEGFYFEPETIENFLLSLKTKPFVILTGNSGTGKTKIAQLFSEYSALKYGECHKIIPVGANWTENRHIVGFYNVITNKYMKSDALEILIQAGTPKNKDKPFFLILDEMNLSHVERYFADFLSAMESKEKISLHKSEDELKKINKETIPQSLKIPKNLFVIGTVNVDETTYMFSPKVLDRANVIEFSTITVKNYMLNGLNQEELNGNIKYLEDPLYGHDLYKSLNKTRVEDLKGYMENVETIEGEILWDVLSEELNKFQEILKKANYDFGFRVIDEILRFIYVSWIYEDRPIIWDNWMRYFDSQIKQKMLPKLHGSQRVLETVLKDLLQQCIYESTDISPRLSDLENKDNIKYPSSALKIQEMDKVLNEQRYVSFIN